MMNTKIDALKKWREEHPEGTKPPRNPWQKWQDHNTRKTAIEAFCWHCMGGTATEATGVQKNIRTCASGPDSEVPCPLHNWRPYR